MKKKLTVNTLALGNLKQRRKQYTIMIIGIILAMVFSSSIVLMMFSSIDTYAENSKLRYGKQDCALVSENLTDEDFEDAIDKGFLNGYGYMHNLGYAYTDEDAKNLGCAVAWLDDNAEEIYYLTLLEGKKPTAENEIAIEQTALNKLGYKDAGIGDKINVSLDVANAGDNTVSKEYTIVGIYSDRKTNIDEESGQSTEYDDVTPAIYVAQGTQVELGGKEKLFAFIESNRDYGTYECKADGEKYKNDFAYFGYFKDKGLFNDDGEQCGYCTGAGHVSSHGGLDELFDGGSYLGIVIAVLVFASCISIVNAFNTNLKERKKQIGLLRAVGTTRSQIINIYGREALFISLIATPISVGISYALVRVGLTLMLNNCVMSKSIWALVISAVVNIIVVMLAAIVPLVIASKTAPMQAIRNVDANRKAKNKKIKSKHSFKPASHLASRNTKFYKGSTAAVSILLTITICFSCIAFSFVTYNYKNIYIDPHDYELRGLGESYFTTTNSENLTGLTEIERQDIANLPYVSETFGTKKLACALEMDELTDYYKILDHETFQFNDDSFDVNSNDELKERLNGEPSKYYIDTKKELGIQKEMINTSLYGYDRGDIDSLDKSKIEGKIDYDKLASGEEIILVAPKKVELICDIKERSCAIDSLYDEQIGKYPPSYESIMTGESSYKVGDEINIYIGIYKYDEKNDVTTLKSVEKKTTKIGAIVSPSAVDFYGSSITGGITSIITTIKGLENFQKNVPYVSLCFDTNLDIDDDLDAQITVDVSNYVEKYEGSFESNYWFTNWQYKENMQMLVGIIAVIIIGFAICISIINNSITAQIRENKRVIGTLRAVGADQKELSKSYIYQMLSMFGWGTGIGYVLFLSLLGIIKLVTQQTGGRFEFIFNPWATIAMTAISFVVCAINVVTRIRKEMKNSIVENIREL